MMLNPLYDVFFAGVSEGKDVEQVKLDFAQLFRVEVTRVEAFFNGGKSRLKARVDEATADKYIARLAILGVIANKVAVTPPEESDLSLQPNDSNSAYATDEPAAPAAAENIARDNSASSGDSNSITRTPFRFSGRGFEYFKIWIVNILLSLVTLGIYSAWAKVRNKQYFYGNTFFANASFEYTAEPLKILKGRVIAVALFIIYSICNKISPMLSLAIAIAMLLVLPWIVVTSLRFNARHSNYRNISFRFLGSIGGAAKAFVAWPLAGIFSFGILMPIAWKKQMAYITNNHSYGVEPFEFNVSVKEYYKVLLVLLGVCVAFAVLVFVVFGSAFMAAAATKDPAVLVKSAFGMVPVFIGYIALYFFIAAYFAVSMANIHFNNTGLQQHRFQSTWSTGSYALLLFSNTLGILLTLGLFIPFARVRTAAYKAEHTSMLVSGDLERFIAADQQQSNALGEGIHDIFDIDISL